PEGLCARAPRAGRDTHRRVRRPREEPRVLGHRRRRVGGRADHLRRPRRPVVAGSAAVRIVRRHSLTGTANRHDDVELTLLTRPAVVNDLTGGEPQALSGVEADSYERISGSHLEERGYQIRKRESWSARRSPADHFAHRGRRKVEEDDVRRLVAEIDRGGIGGGPNPLRAGVAGAGTGTRVG